jgi:hypothetical protein
MAATLTEWLYPSIITWVAIPVIIVIVALWSAHVVYLWHRTASYDLTVWFFFRTVPRDTGWQCCTRVVLRLLNHVPIWPIEMKTYLCQPIVKQLKWFSNESRDCRENERIWGAC